MTAVQLAREACDSSILEPDFDFPDLPPLGSWVVGAACRGMPEVFTAYPREHGVASMVERMCRRCPVREACEAFAAENEVVGVWAGSWRG
jgi:hypothetical protein